MTKTTAQWIGPFDMESEPIVTGHIAFLIEKSHATKRWTRHDLRDTPACTNQSLKPQLYGWCGSYNDLSTRGAGLVRVERVANNGRCFVRELAGDELRAGLESLGYPELMPA